MKITKTYLRYREDNVFGAIVSEQPKVSYAIFNQSTSCCVSGASENAILWDLKRSTAISVLSRPNSVTPVSCCAVAANVDSTQTLRLAVGYADGWVYIFNASTSDVEAQFRAGRSRVTSMDFQVETLISSADSDINVLDLISGSGFRLKGHKGIVSRVRLMPSRNILLSCAQDSFIKFWDLKSQHCFATLTGHSAPVWDFALARDDSILISGTNDPSLRIWKIAYIDRSEGTIELPPVHTNNNEVELVTPMDEHQSLIRMEYLGHLQRSTNRRVHSLVFDATGSYLVCQSFERNLEVFWLLDEAAQTKRLKKKMKKAKDQGLPPGDVRLEVGDLLRPILHITMAVKLTSCDVLPLRPTAWNDGICVKKSFRVLYALKNNTIEEIEVSLPTSGPHRLQKLKVLEKTYQQESVSGDNNSTASVRLLSRVAGAGHRSPPLVCCLTSDTLGVFSLAASEAKLWNRHTGACLVTLDWKGLDRMGEAAEQSHSTGAPDKAAGPSKASAMALAPGDRNVIIGFESGHILMFDVNSKSVKQVIEGAHQGAIRGLALSGDKKGVISGGSDKIVRFYSFDLNIPDHGPPNLCLVESRDRQQVADQVTCLACSPNNRLAIFGLVNFHVDVFFLDSFKRIHSLYGHAAPVTSVDISSDSRLILTGSGDKTVRLWELQFGNCQRRFTSHTDPVTSVRFIPHTPLAVSGDLAGNIKQWDVVKLREVSTLRGHNAGVSCLATGATNAALLKVFAGKQKKASSDNPGRGKPSKRGGKHSKQEDEDGSDNEEDQLVGGLVVSSGRDFAIRVWSESEELLVLEEEAELAREAAEDEEELARTDLVVAGATPADVGATAPLGRSTVLTRDAADMLMEAIDVYTAEVSARQSAVNQPAHPLLVARGFADRPEHFLLTSLASLRTSAAAGTGGGGAGLEHALGALTTQHVRLLLPRLASWLARGWHTELAGRALRHLVTLHVGLVTSSRQLRQVLQRTRSARLGELTRLKNLVGMNLAGLEYLQRKLEESQQVVLFRELWTSRAKRGRGPRKTAKRSRSALLVSG